MNSLRAYYKSEYGERYGHQSHLNNGSGKPLCGNKVRTGADRCLLFQWREFATPATCPHCLKKVEK